MNQQVSLVAFVGVQLNYMLYGSVVKVVCLSFVLSVSIFVILIVAPWILLLLLL